MLAVEGMSNVAGSSRSRPVSWKGRDYVHSRTFPSPHLTFAPLMASDTAQVLNALMGHDPLKPCETIVASEIWPRSAPLHLSISRVGPFPR